jgi:hypothetical protein
MNSLSQSKASSPVSTLDNRVTSRAAFWIVAGSCGISAALLLVLIHPSLRIPGSAILRAMIPLAFGYYLSKDRNLGFVMSIFAAGALTITPLFGIAAKISPTAALLLIGPLLDLASRIASQRPKLAILAFGLAGGLANSIAFLFRAIIANALLGEDHQLQSFGIGVFMSFVLCGVLSGLVCGLIAETRKTNLS